MGSRDRGRGRGRDRGREWGMGNGEWGIGTGDWGLTADSGQLIADSLDWGLENRELSAVLSAAGLFPDIFFIKEHTDNDR